MRIFVSILWLSMICILGKAQAPDFSGRWTQDNDRCQPKRKGVVMLQIEHHDPNLTVETLVNRDAMTSRHAIQKYTTDGKPSTSTGTDGDEFHTAVTWTNSGLVFSVEEHEDGRILRSRETWRLLESGSILQRTRERPDGQKQILVFRRQQSANAW